MATYYPCEQNYEKVNSESMEIMPNEIILNIFTHLTIKDLGRCAQVSKNFCAIAYDKTLWTKILVTSRIMPHRLLVQALSRGAKYLGLSKASFVSMSQPNFPPTNKVEYLALSDSFMDENYFRQFILSCHNLKKLSVTGPFVRWKSDDLLKGILQNSNSLKVLDLGGCDNLESQDFQSIMSSCLNLTEANFSFSFSSFIFENCAPNIEKLGLSKVEISINEIITLFTQCNKLTDLDLTWASIIDEIGHRNIKFPTKTQLQSLYIKDCDIKSTHLEMLILSCENSLQLLDFSYFQYKY